MHRSHPRLRSAHLGALLLLTACLPAFAGDGRHGDHPANTAKALAPTPSIASSHHHHRVSLSQLSPTQPWQTHLTPRDKAQLGLTNLGFGPSALKNATAPCDDNGFASKAGQDLVDHIRNAPTDPDTNTSCVNRLFNSAADSVRFAAFQAQNMIDAGNAAANLGVTYDGTNSSNLKELFLFLRAGYFVHFYNPEQFSWGTGVQNAVVGAIDAFVANGSFYADSEAHAETLGEVLIAMDSTEEQARYLGVVKEWLSRWNTSYASKFGMRSAVNGIFTQLFRGHQQQAFRDAVATDTTLMVRLRDFATSTWMVDGDAQFMAENAARELARFLQYDTAASYAAAKAGVQTILSTYAMDGFGAGIWIAAAAGADFYDDCNEYGICGFATQLEQQILSVQHACSPTLKIRAQQMTSNQLTDSCQLLEAQEVYFHQRLQTSNNPVTGDLNEDLEVVVFDSYDDYATYSNLFFGNSTNNGGIYLEGDPSDPNNQARFLAHEATWLPDFAIWNLEHEYVHYLDGRFDMLGDFGDYRVGTHKTVWWLEGLAEYISKKDDNPGAIEVAPTKAHTLSTLFANTYSSGTERIYTWGYLAVRFMFEAHPGEVNQILTYFRAGDYDNYLSYIDSSIGTAYDGEWSNWLDNVDTGGGGGGGGNDGALTNGVPETGLGANTGEALSFYLDVPAGATDLRFETSGGTGDVDLYVRFGAEPTLNDYDCRPYIGGNAESCDEASPQAGRWYVLLQAYSTYADVTLTGTFTEGGGGGGGGGGGPISLTNGQPLVSQGAATGEEIQYTLQVPAHATDLRFESSGGSGDADLYVRFGAEPTFDQYDCRPYIGGNAESCDFPTPQAGTWHVMLRGYATFSDVTLTGSFTAGGSSACTGTPVTGGELLDEQAVCVDTSSQRRYFYLFVPNGTNQLTVTLSGGTGNADLYGKSGGWPSTSDYDVRSTQGNNDEIFQISNPASGWFYLMLTDESEFSGASLVADWQ